MISLSLTNKNGAHSVINEESETEHDVPNKIHRPSMSSDVQVELQNSTPITKT